MAKQVIVNQSSREEKIYPLEFAPSLLAGVAVEDAELFYSGDNDIDDQPTLDSTVVGSIVYVSVSSGLAVGKHRVRCVAITDNEDLSPEIELLIDTKS